MNTNKHSAAEPQPNSLSSIQNGGEGRGEEAHQIKEAPLLGPLPTRSSRGEEEELARNDSKRMHGPSTLCHEPEKTERKPGVCIPWEEKLKEIPEISGDPALAKKIWEDVDGLGYVYIWHCLVSF